MVIFSDGALTVEQPEGKVNVIRCHSDPNHIPGDWDWACIIDMYEDGSAEPKILHGTRGPTLAEIRTLSAYFKSVGYSIVWHRYKSGKRAKEVKI